MTQQEKQEIDKKCDEFCEYRRTHSSGYPPREWFMAGVKALDELRKPSEPETNVGEAGEELVKVKSIESELIALQAFIVANLPSDFTEDYAFPDSTSRKTIRNVMRIINESNERFMKRVRYSVAIREANKEIAALMQPDKELLEALKDVKLKKWIILEPSNVGAQRSRERLSLDAMFNKVEKAISNYEKQSK